MDEFRQFGSIISVTTLYEQPATARRTYGHMVNRVEKIIGSVENQNHRYFFRPYGKIPFILSLYFEFNSLTTL
jgi:hypothetical protein